MSDDDKLGATGDFPHGKMAPDDEGELVVAISIDGDTVRVDFGPKPVAWIAYDADGAIAFAAAIHKHAMALKFRAHTEALARGETKQ
jgi:hypothetical protein